MARYFNRTRGPVAVALKTGESTIVRPKGTLIVTPEQDGSASLHAKVRKKILVRLEEKPASPVPLVVESPQAEAPPGIEEELDVREPEEEAPEDDEFEDDGIEDAPSMQWTKAQLIDYALSLDLDVSSSSTKVEILRAIEETDR